VHKGECIAELILDVDQRFERRSTRARRTKGGGPDQVDDGLSDGQRFGERDRVEWAGLGFTSANGIDSGR